MSNPERFKAPPADEDPSRLRALADRYGLAFLPSVPPEILDPAAVENLPVEWARSHCILPVKIAGEYCVLTADPERIADQEYLAMLLGRDLRPVLAPRSEILQSIERCFFSRDHSPADFLRELPADATSRVDERPHSEDLLRAAEEAPVTQLVNLILLEAVKRRASDIHFEPFESRLRVRYRIDGLLYEQTSPPKNLEAALVSRLKVMARMDIAEKRLPQDGMARVRVGEREIDIRVSTVPVAEGERVVLRLLDRDSALLPLSALGMSEEVLRKFSTLLGYSTGMIVVAGPTGSGKTTTLYAALGQLDTARRNILTIEDPIEYQLPNIGQIQVKPKIGLTFANGLRHILRQDPDVILVGETRDLETAEIAMRAALTGHLVFTTLHTNDAPSAVLRLADMGVEPYLIAACLRGVLAQRLVRRLCLQCRRPTKLRAEELDPYGPMALELADKPVWAPGGCPACLEGYHGRTGLFELMVMDAELQAIVRSGGAGVDRLRAAAELRGMTTLFRDALNKVVEGVTSLAEVVGIAEIVRPR